MTTVVVVGSYGTGNVGDEAILLGVVSGLKEVFESETQVIVFSQAPESTTRIHGVPSHLQSRLHAVGLKHRIISNADLVIVGGGGLFQNNRGGRMNLLTGTFAISLSYLAFAALARTSAITMGVGIGPIHGNLARMYARTIFSTAKALSVRDQYSYDYAIELGVDSSKLNLTADPAYLLTERFHRSTVDSEVIRVGLTLRPVWTRVPNRSSWNIDTNPAYLPPFTQALDDFIERVGACVDFLPFGGTLDSQLYEKLLLYSRLPNRYRLLAINDPHDLPVIYANLTMIIGMRLHSIIAASMARVPCVPILYDVKVASIADVLSLTDIALSLSSLHERDRVGAALKTAWNMRREIGQQMHLIAREQHTSAKTGLLIAKEVVERN